MAEVVRDGWEWVNDYQGALLVVFALAAAIVALVQLHLTRDIRKRELEDIYTQRYWALCDQLSREGRRCFELHQPLPTKEEFDDDRALLRRYLELCEDQADMRAAGYVTSKTWKLWWPAIHSATTRSPVAEVMEEWLARARELEVEALPLTRLRGSRQAGPDYDPA